MPARQRQTLRYFYPRSPCGERLCNMHSLRYCCTNFYPRSPCGERPRSGRPCRAVHKFLSTLSLRRATLKIHLHYLVIINFYPHSPCGERPRSPKISTLPWQFLSTLSLRRATIHFFVYLQINIFLSTLSLRRATHLIHASNLAHFISIHTLLAESDKRFIGASYGRTAFLSTLSLRRATAPRFQKFPSVGDFYPHSPCGERPPWDQLRHK